MIEIHGVSKSFGSGNRRTQVLDDITLDVGKGSVAGVIGSSGAGKSTLLRCVNRLEQVDSGEIRVDGRSITGQLSASEEIGLRRRTGMVFQASSLLRHRSASGNVSYPLEVHGVPRRERKKLVAELLERVGLSKQSTSFPSQLSGGQRQRVGIARALALQPTVLLADEATSGLDPVNTDAILTLLRNLRDDLDLTILLITHEMDIVRRYCDQAALLRDGRLVDSGRVAELAGDPESELGQQLFRIAGAATPEAGERILDVRLASRTGTDDWLPELTLFLGRCPRLLAASIEPRDRLTLGVARIAVPDDAVDETTKWLTANGHHTQEFAP